MKEPSLAQIAVSDRPPVFSLLDLDFYKISMGQFIYLYYPDVMVRIKLINRGPEKLGLIIPEHKLRAALDHVMSLTVDFSEESYLRGVDNYGERVLKEPYLKFFRQYRAPQYHLEYLPDGEIDLWVEAPWKNDTYWELYLMRIVNELYFRELLLRMSPLERDMVFAEGKRRLAAKIEFFNANPDIFFANFGCRRCFSYEWAYYVDWALKQGIKTPGQFRGTSSVLIAKELGLEPIGTNAHELQMVLAAIAESDSELAEVPHRLLDQWYDLYGPAMAVVLPDTFGSRYMMRTMSQKNAERYRGIRLDSGDPAKEGDEWIQFWKDRGIDHVAAKKFLIPSDDLKVPTTVKPLHEHFKSRVPASDGIGTHLTNDLGLTPLKIVAKVTHANGRPAIKLSNVPGKISGPPDLVERYKRVFGYNQD
ncbi:MAG TPA: nicotinate phosphoribosyltransferase [Candidatus Paceibacterota bacterium]|nr:nicotinate phosphoribosyltransferase [Candidatus Paceibacterota bacterium]